MFTATPQVKENFKTMKYIIYARKSTKDEDHQILSIEPQLVELREFAAKEKLEIIKERGEPLNFLGFAAAPSPEAERVRYGVNSARGENRPS